MYPTHFQALRWYSLSCLSQHAKKNQHQDFSPELKDGNQQNSKVDLGRNFACSLWDGSLCCRVVLLFSSCGSNSDVGGCCGLLFFLLMF